MFKKIKEFTGQVVKALAIGILGVGAVIGAVALALAIIALGMTIPAGILWYVLPLLGYTVEFYKLWAGCMALKILGGLLFNHNTITASKD